MKDLKGIMQKLWKRTSSCQVCETKICEWDMTELDFGRRPVIEIAITIELEVLKIILILTCIMSSHKETIKNVSFNNKTSSVRMQNEK
jgi:hypothetical protein